MTLTAQAERRAKPGEEGGRALLLTDLQNDFGEDGTLPVQGGQALALRTTEFLDDYAGEYDMIVASRCWHFDPGDHWSDMPDNQTSFVKHCEAETWGADYLPYLEQGYISHEVYKGLYTAAFSPFEGSTDFGKGVTLDSLFNEAGIVSVDVTGLAADFCVKAGALGSVRRGYITRLLKPLTRAVFGDKGLEESCLEMREAGVIIVDVIV